MLGMSIDVSIHTLFTTYIHKISVKMLSLTTSTYIYMMYDILSQ
jgi:hypothetical protein